MRNKHIAEMISQEIAYGHGKLTRIKGIDADMWEGTICINNKVVTATCVWSDDLTADEVEFVIQG